MTQVNKAETLKHLAMLELQDVTPGGVARRITKLSLQSKAGSWKEICLKTALSPKALLLTAP